MDPSEIIAREYLELCEKFFVMHVRHIPVRRGYTDVDILATNGQGKYFAIEVKAQLVKWGPKDIKMKIIPRIKSKERKFAIRAIIGDNEYKDILLTAKQSVGKLEKQKMFDDAKIKLWYWEDILSKFISMVDTKKSYGSVSLQLLRLLKDLDILKISP